MASSSSSFPSRNYKFNVFASFHGPDVRKTLLSHMREQFKRNGITMFDDQEIERSATIAPSLKEAIKESRISIVILSKRYASSSWCLDELVDILESKKAMRQVVMTIFYGVDPSDVRKHSGDFGIAFNETCARKTEAERQKWIKALNEVGNIAGEDFLRWDSEAKMIEKIARDVSNKLNATPSRDFDGMVGLEAHLREMDSLLDLDYDGVKMVAITGPAGIGKTTIAKALHSLLSNRFQLTCFVDNLKGSYHSGLDELCLQEQFLSKILNQDGVRICHSGVIEERLCKQRVLIIIDDANHIRQLEALANETTWFGPGSRIVVTTENQELLKQHNINNTYHVGLPSRKEALEILCRYAFRKSYPHDGFEELALKVTEICGKLPLALRVVGSSLRGKEEEEWEDIMSRLETILDRDIAEVLRVGYENLNDNDQMLFLHIAVFFNYEDGNLVKAMLDDGNLDVKHGLKILVNRSLIEMDGERIKMHKLLQQMARQAILKQEPWNRQILMDAHEICDVLENETGTRAVSGILFDKSRIDEVTIGKKAFKRVPNLRFLRVFKSKDDGNDSMHIPEAMEFPRRLRLLDWKAYPSKCLPPTFHLEHLVELKMKKSQLEYLWQGTQKLTNLKKMILCESYHLKKLPDLSNATNLEILDLSFCKSLVEIPSSFSHLHKLEKLTMAGCVNLQVIPAHLNLASLESIYMGGCSKLRNFLVMSTHITSLNIQETEVEDVPASVSVCTHLESLNISRNEKLKRISHLPCSVRYLNLSYSDIERLPHSIRYLHGLYSLYLSGCRKLASLPELPRSLEILRAEDCESLETLLFPVNASYAYLDFTNCFKLGEEARRAIIRQIASHGKACIPGKEVPAEFDHKARGNSLTVRLDGNRAFYRCTMFRFCLVVSPKRKKTQEYRGSSVLCRVSKDESDPVDEVVSVFSISKCRKEHLFVFPFVYGNKFEDFFQGLIFSDMSREIVFEFSSVFHDFDVIECGVQIIGGFYESLLDQLFEHDDGSVTSGSDESEISEAFESDDEDEDDDSRYEFEPREASHEELIRESIEEENCEGEKRTDCWSWILLCFGFSDIARKIRNKDDRTKK